MPLARKSVEPLSSRSPASTAAGAARPATRRCEALPAAVARAVLPAIARHGPITARGVDDTALPKKGGHAVGVAPQSCGQLGKVADCRAPGRGRPVPGQRRRQPAGGVPPGGVPPGAVPPLPAPGLGRGPGAARPGLRAAGGAVPKRGRARARPARRGRGAGPASCPGGWRRPTPATAATSGSGPGRRARPRPGPRRRDRPDARPAAARRQGAARRLRLPGARAPPSPLGDGDGGPAAAA